MNKVLAWFITFNFINITMVFFRAKEWDDAVKVLSGMVGLSSITLPVSSGNRLNFLENYGVEFGAWLNHIQGSNETIKWILVAFFIILIFKNSNEKLNQFSLNYVSLLLSVIAFVGAILSVHNNSEFLYFNF
jgi:hypothetical protein